MQASPKGRAIAWAVLAIIGLVNMAGYAFDIYQRFWWFDRLLHAATIFALTLWLALFVYGGALRGGYSGLAVLLVASVGLALGAIWEVVEWGFDQVAPGDVIKGKHDTVIDIVMDAIGALLAGLASLAFLRPSGREDMLANPAPQGSRRVR